METREFKDKKNDMVFRDTIWLSLVPTNFTFYRNIVELNELKNFMIDCSDRVLDVGAGEGRITREFAKSGAEIIALDYSVESLKTNRAKSGAQVIVADMCYLPFRSSVFNKVVAISVLQYIPTPESRLKALKEIRRALKPNSTFLLQTYNYRPLYDGLIKRRKDDFHRSAPVHFYRFSCKELSDLLLSVFAKVLKFRAILILNPLMQGRLGNTTIFAKLAAFLEEKVMTKTRFSFLFAEHLVATCEKL